MERATGHQTASIWGKFVAIAKLAPSAYFLAIVVTLVATSIGLSTLAVHFGRDLNFDFLNYHLYVGLSASGDRLKQDFFPAGIQSYLAPYSYLPLLWLIRWELSSDTVVAILALMQSLVAIPLAMLCMRLNGTSPNFLKWLWMLVMALATPVLFLELGNTFNDLGCSALTLLGLVLAIPPTSKPLSRWQSLLRLTLSGTFTGVGVALKLSLAPVSVAIPLVALIAWQDTFQNWRARVRLALCWSAGAAGGLVVAYGPWAYQLYREFGNPVFPFFNAVFQSPYFPTFNFSHERFRPHSAAEFVARPFALLQFARNVYVETPAPDARPAAYIAMAALAFILALIRATGRVYLPVGNKSCRNSTELAIHVYVVVSWVLWLAISGNGRYALPLFLVLGAVVAHRVASLPRVFALVGASILTAAHVSCLVDGVSVVRWSPYAPHKQLVDIDAPEHFRTTAAAYVTLEPQSASFLAAFAHPASSFINLIGSVPLAPDGLVGQRVGQTLMQQSRHFAVLSIPLMDAGTHRPLGVPNKVAAAEKLRPYGLDLTDGVCDQISMLGAYPSILSVETAPGHRVLAAVNQGYWLCPMRVTGYSAPRTDDFFLRATPLLDALERKCTVFRPVKSAVTVSVSATVIERTYANTDATVRAVQTSSGSIELLAKTHGSDVNFRIGVSSNSNVSSDSWTCP